MYYVWVSKPTTITPGLKAIRPKRNDHTKNSPKGMVTSAKSFLTTDL